MRIPAAGVIKKPSHLNNTRHASAGFDLPCAPRRVTFFSSRLPADVPAFSFLLAPSFCLSKQYPMKKKLIEVALSLIVIEQACFKKQYQVDTIINEESQ